MPPVRIAIIGCGVITEDFHLPAALKSNRVSVAALVDTDTERANLLKRKYGCAARVAANLSEVIGETDAVLIATPNHTHAQLARLAIDNGLAVLVEKPMTTTSEDAFSVYESSKAKGVPFSVGFFTRHYPVVALMKRLLDQGTLGRIKSFHFEYGTQGGWAPVSAYNLDRKQSGGGVLVVMGSHFLDRMLYWFGEPQNFNFADDSYGTGVEANCRAAFRFADGMTGSMFLSKTVALKNRFTLQAEHYDVELAWGETRQLTLYPHCLSGTSALLGNRGEAKDTDYFQVQIDEFARVIREGGWPTVDAWMGARNVQLCEELYAKRTQLEEPWLWYRSAAMAEK